MKKTIFSVFCIAMLAAVVLTACGGPAATNAPIETSIPATEAPPQPTAEPAATATAAPAPTLPIPEGYMGGKLPVDGAYNPDLEAIDKAMIDFMNERGIDAGELVVLQKGKIVLEHAYGWFDEKHTRPLTTNAVMRIASVSKPITKAILKILIDEGKLKRNQKVFCLDGATTDCLLTIEPIKGAQIDPQLKDITVDMLINHKGGFDRAKSFDPMFGDIKIAKALGIASPPDKYQIASYMMGQKLDFKPGSKEAYSNYGYALLGMIIEKVTGKTYIQYVQEDFFAPLDVKDVYLAQTLPENRRPDEPYYSCPAKGPSAYKPGTQVCWPDGAWSIEKMDAHGGILTSAHTLGVFLSNYCLSSGAKLGESKTCGNWWFYGSLDGTLSLIRQDPNGSAYALIFNKRSDKTHENYEDIRKAIDDALLTVTKWP
ncbi:MAG: beta-lactamase family protein [Anaerolineaceae bacterium]|nr:beta-lactamase family protein [Anaerolineaceae bacterium]